MDGHVPISIPRPTYFRRPKREIVGTTRERKRFATDHLKEALIRDAQRLALQRANRAARELEAALARVDDLKREQQESIHAWRSARAELRDVRGKVAESHRVAWEPLQPQREPTQVSAEIYEYCCYVRCLITSEGMSSALCITILRAGNALSELARERLIREVRRESACRGGARLVWEWIGP